MQIILKVQRYDPQQGAGPVFIDYHLDLSPTERILDALLYVKRRIDGSLGLRRSCGHGVCGSDAMIINGKERLACKTLVKDVAAVEIDQDIAEREGEGTVVYVEPLRHLPIERDLMVDQTAFFAKFRAMTPYFINDEPVEERERIQSPEDRKVFEDPTNCILCAACYSACPVLDATTEFIGPAAVVQVARFLFDTRDRGFAERLDGLDAPEGVSACQSFFECTRVCPRSIKVTKNINLTKQKIKKYREGMHETT